MSNLDNLTGLTQYIHGMLTPVFDGQVGISRDKQDIQITIHSVGDPRKWVRSFLTSFTGWKWVELKSQRLRGGVFIFKGTVRRLSLSYRVSRGMK